MMPTHARPSMESGGMSETARRCLALIERHVPRLMRQGGGPLMAEIERCRKATPKETAEALRLCAAGFKAKIIALQIGRSEPFVSKQLRAHGCVAAGSRPKERREAAIAMLLAGHSRKEVQNRFKVSKYSVCKWAARADARKAATA